MVEKWIACQRRIPRASALVGEKKQWNGSTLLLVPLGAVNALSSYSPVSHRWQVFVDVCRVVHIYPESFPYHGGFLSRSESMILRTELPRANSHHCCCWLPTATAQTLSISCNRIFLSDRRAFNGYTGQWRRLYSAAYHFPKPGPSYIVPAIRQWLT